MAPTRSSLGEVGWSNPVATRTEPLRPLPTPGPLANGPVAILTADPARPGARARLKNGSLPQQDDARLGALLRRQARNRPAPATRRSHAPPQRGTQRHARARCPRLQ